MTSYYNYEAYSGQAGWPTGAQTFFSVPFSFAASAAAGTNYNWHARVGDAAAPKLLSMNTNIADAAKVHIFMNTYWGQTTTSYVQVKFSGTGGTYSKDLYGNVDLRDFLCCGWTTTINGTSTRAAWSSDGTPTNGADDYSTQRLDVVTFDLPAGFGTLQNITVLDTGINGSQRVFVSAATVETADTPEPGTVALMGAGLGLIGVLRRRSR